LFGWQALLRSGAHAGWGQLRNRPREWGQGGLGFARRFGSGIATRGIKESIQLGVAVAHHENLHYERSNLESKWPRVKYAIKRTFVVPRTDNKGNTAALGRISGNFGAGLISRAWQPASAAGIGAGFASGGIGLGADVGFNVLREFWPQKRRKGAASPNAANKPVAPAYAHDECASNLRPHDREGTVTSCN
jgi:hypothetical protein